MKDQPGTKWNRTPNPQQEAQKHQEWFEDFKKQTEADPQILRRLVQEAGIYDENGNLTEKYRDPEQS